MQAPLQDLEITPLKPEPELGLTPGAQKARPEVPSREAPDLRPAPHQDTPFLPEIFQFQSIQSPTVSPTPS